ncbi:ABC transporter substrate-binding protein [Halogeometricum sp. S1BR25-6]|uniref:ABC transporter substrate-binding protein n=1 Tax=Halogeometricum salsisoli TaxID=2950536 RepID=A0ABU2GJ74_9EURY|nr:ABC transporter substrate-binding protein [Halogeometricum sp. S1BR25-6]MDS0300113.1 ABC transporter substrate-binding protein [Halogeometricum sp. S1BR25-6]
MHEERTGQDGPTRRRYLRLGGAVVAGSLLAGCTGGSDAGSTAESATDTATTAPGTETDSNASESESESTAVGDSYSVTMAPMGEVAFDAVPETVFTRLTHLAGMAFALGRGNDVNAMHAPDYYDGVWNQFTPRLDSVELDWSGLYSSWTPSKEKLYELDSDVHLADPASVFAEDNWGMDDIEEIAGNVAPWFGNAYSARRQEPPKEWADRYEYYGLWEMFEKVAQVFDAKAQYDALADVHSGLLDTIESDLPPEGERPSVVMAMPNDFEQIYVYKVTNPGTLTAHTRPLKPVEALSDDVSSGDAIDIEGLLEADPDVILGNGGMAPGTDMAQVRRTLEDDPVASQLSAVRNGRVYAQAARYQGPILNLFQLEMTAKQLYPDRFGEWPTYAEGPYPELPEDERLFDRRRVADAINGDV